VIGIWEVGDMTMTTSDERTVFDKMLLEKLIEMPHWVAVSTFIYEVGDSCIIDEMEYAYGHTPGVDGRERFVELMKNPFQNLTKSQLKSDAAELMGLLTSLAEYYGVSDAVDPRDIIRRQVRIG
jgi:hypothetical protein